MFILNCSTCFYNMLKILSSKHIKTCNIITSFNTKTWKLKHWLHVLCLLLMWLHLISFHVIFSMLLSKESINRQAKKSCLWCALNFPKSLITFIVHKNQALFLGLKQTQLVSKQELKQTKSKCASEQTKNTNKHKQKSSTQKKTNGQFFFLMQIWDHLVMMPLCVWFPIWGAQTNKVNFFNDARAMMVNLYIDTSFPQHHQVVERVLVILWWRCSYTGILVSNFLEEAS
jgi:hypothetical protein